MLASWYIGFNLPIPFSYNLLLKTLLRNHAFVLDLINDFGELMLGIWYEEDGVDSQMFLVEATPAGFIAQFKCTSRIL